MFSKAHDIMTGLDRLSTPDEIRIALALPQAEEVEVDAICMEIPSDRGGYTRISLDEYRFWLVVEEASRPSK